MTLPDNLVPILSTVEEAAGHCPQLSVEISWDTSRQMRKRLVTIFHSSPPTGALLLLLPPHPTVRHFFCFLRVGSLWFGLASCCSAFATTGPPPLPGRLKPVAGSSSRPARETARWLRDWRFLLLLVPPGLGGTGAATWRRGGRWVAGK